ncbi:PilW family protein [Cellvibrio mixtus]|uniref:PilW family protein n=1 Tax=Cellvibrio mixtus TaxID=39650 RepID=UPI000693A59F|nr:hypothetical protein [Cellvibrio mixtus]
MRPLHKQFFLFQKGISLISLMVGLLLAMISILAGMLLYKNIVQSSVQARSDALQDGQIASAMLTLQLELQSAGYGIAKDPTTTHVQLVDGKTLYWRFKDGSAQCRSFRIEDNDAGTHRKLVLLKLTSGCDETSALNSFSWNDADKVEINPLAEFRKSDATAVDLPVITIDSVAPASCFPYGMGTKGVHPLVTITADNAAITAAKKIDATAAGPNAPFRYDFCLSNL